MILDADYKDNTFDVGFLILNKDGELWKGIVKYNKHGFEMLDGIIYHRLVQDSIKNYNYDAEEMWIEDQIQIQDDPEYWKSVANEIDKEEPVGHKIFEDFIYQNGTLVKRENSTKEYQYAG